MANERRLAFRVAAGTLLPAWEATADVVVVGTGVAGLTAALTTGGRRDCRCC